jgi:hypothetical protein
MECPQGWIHALGFLGRAREGLRVQAIPALLELKPVIAKGFAPLCLHLFAEGRRHRALTDLAAVQLVASGGIAEATSPEIAWQLFLRAECACDFVGQLFPEECRESPVGELPQAWDAPRLARWLLTESWHRRGDSWMKLVAIELVGPFPFYGIEAVPEWL